MAKFDRYMLSQLLAVFGIASLILVLVYWINQAVRLFDQIISSGESAAVFVELSILTLPQVIKLVLPISAFAATVYVANRMSSESELVIVQSTGFSPWRMARPVLVFGLIVAAFMTVLAHVLVPASLSRLAERQAEIAENVTSRLLTEGRFLHPSDGVTFYIREITPEGALRGIFLSDTRRADRRVTYSASEALLVRSETGPRLVMFDGMAQTYATDSGRLAVTRFDDFAYDISALIETPSMRPPRLRERYTDDILSLDPTVLEESRATAETALLEVHSRFTNAILAVVAPLVGFATLLLGGYSRFGVWRQIVGAVAAIVVLQVIGNALADVALSRASLWPLHYVPNLIGALLAVAMFWLAAHPGALRRRPEAAPG